MGGRGGGGGEEMGAVLPTSYVSGLETTWICGIEGLSIGFYFRFYFFNFRRGRKKTVGE